MRGRVLVDLPLGRVDDRELGRSTAVLDDGRSMAVRDDGLVTWLEVREDVEALDLLLEGAGLTRPLTSA